MPKKNRKLADKEVMFLDKIIDINLALNAVVDSRTSILAGIGGVISVISIGELFTSSGIATLGFLTIIITGLVAMLLSVGVIRPKALNVKRQNLMYYSGICFSEFPEYYEQMKETLSDDEKITFQYSKEAHDLSSELSARFKLLKCIVDILITGLLMGFMLVIVSIFV